MRLPKKGSLLRMRLYYSSGETVPVTKLEQSLLKKENFPTFLVIVLSSLMKTTGALQAVQRGFRLLKPEFQKR